VKPSLHQMLAESRIAAVAIAVLLVWSLDSGFRALWDPLFRLAHFLFTAVAIFGIPYFSFTGSDRLSLITTLSYLFFSVIYLFAAWLLSRWVYGVGPLRSLTACHAKLRGRNHA